MRPPSRGIGGTCGSAQAGIDQESDHPGREFREPLARAVHATGQSQPAEPQIADDSGAAVSSAVRSVARRAGGACVYSFQAAWVSARLG